MTLLDEATWAGRIYSDGWRTASGGTAPVLEPATGAVLGTIGIAGTDDVTRAAATAAAAQGEWAATPPEERAAILRRAGQLWEENAFEIEHWLVHEAGSIPPKAQLEIHRAAQDCYEAAALVTHPTGEVLAKADETGCSLRDSAFDISVEREADPLGLAPTASTATTMAVGDALAAGLMVLSGFTAEDFALRHPGGSLGSYLSEVGQ
jgi:benzaldehyde dehydrogenase (NAD)